MAGRLKGKVALVTGAASGIGRASALEFAREGAKVIVADVVVKDGRGTVELIRKEGGQSEFVKADVSKAAEVEAMVNKTVEIYGRLDCAHNNAGVVEEGATIDFTEESFDRTMNVNLKGVWLCMKYEIIQMLKQHSGAIVNTASVQGLVGRLYLAVYSASKHGVVGLTKSAALEYFDSGIRINAVCPGLTRTPPIERIIAQDPAAEAVFLKFTGIGRMGTPKEIAHAITWLCSDEASFVTGQAVAVDGGWTAH